MGILKMAAIAQAALFAFACTFLYGLVGFLFRDQITSRPVKAQVIAGENLIDMTARPSASEGKRQ